MTILRLAPRARNAVADVFTAMIDAGDGPGTLSIYTGPIPPNAAAELTDQELLGVLTFGRPPAPPTPPAAGPQGRGIVHAMIDADGNLVLVYSDETSHVVGRVRGRDGAPPVPAPPAAIPSVAAPVPTRRLVEFVRDPATGQLMSGIITDSPEAT